MESNIEKLRRLREAREFKPIELTEDNVNTIYRRCLPTENTSPNDIIKYYMFFKQKGFKENANPFYFDVKKLQKEAPNIAYLLGQLYDVHVTRDGFLYLKNFSLNYNNTVWLQTDDIDEARATIFNLISMGSTCKDKDNCRYIGPIQKNVQACDNIGVEPTLSPKDPKFEEWANSEKGKKLLLTFKSRDEGEQK